MTHILALSGSLRRGSVNTALLRAAAGLLPGGSTLERFDYRDLPHFNADLSDPAQLAPVERLKAAITAADAVLIATPEFNYGIPGPLKNAIDWASRPAYRSPFAGKPVGVLGASPGAVGSARAQGHLKQVLLGMVAQPFPHPEFLMGGAFGKIDGADEPTVTDASTLEHLQKYLDRFVAWVQAAASYPVAR